MLWYFQEKKEGIQPYIYMDPLFPKPSSPPGCQVTSGSFMCYTVGPCCKPPIF